MNESIIIMGDVSTENVSLGGTHSGVLTRSQTRQSRQSVIFLGPDSTENVNLSGNESDGVLTRNRRSQLRQSVIFLGPVDADSSNSRPASQSRRKPRKNKENVKPVTAVVDLTRESGDFKPSGKGKSPKITKDTNKEKRVAASLECPVCLESLANVEVKVTHCGHLFCAKCIEALSTTSIFKCPKCRTTLVKGLIRPVYL